LGCYELARFGGDHDAMVEELMSIYRTRPDLRLPALEEA
jgi:2,4-dienoyl-CoA reductase (NADPH2)